MRTELNLAAEGIRNEAVFVVNFFALSSEYQEIRPRYYVFADPTFWDTSISHEFQDRGTSVLELIKNTTDWELDIIIPYAAAKRFVAFFKDKPNIHVYYFNLSTFDTDTRLDYSVYESGYGAPHIQNVLVLAVFASILAGFKEVNLLGAAHSWLEELRVNAENEVCLLDKHFYDDNQDVKLLPWKKIAGGIYKMHEILIDLSRTFLGYHKMQNFALHKGVKIYNCTEGSYIDAFPRKKL
ncbi:hypothetical protein [Pedobacter sp. BAL39]|uniref:hypothetical protein n=1 Tax=Pedobacter sp. BAL39 TaxID=391596 RepID=UPI0018DBD339|nr:hypothetical protein [Pedobacter sp. BAL39]